MLLGPTNGSPPASIGASHFTYLSFNLIDTIYVKICLTTYRTSKFKQFLEK